MTLLDIEGLKAKAEKATAGPWTLEVGDWTHRYVMVTGDNDLTVHYKYGAGTKADSDKDEADAEYIVAACNAVPELIAQRAELVEAARRYIAAGDAYVASGAAFGNDVAAMLELGEAEYGLRQAIVRTQSTGEQS